AYRLGVRDAREIPVIQALDTPARIQPADPGGTQFPNQGLEVNEIPGGDAAQTPRETTLAPASLPLTNEDTPAQAEVQSEESGQVTEAATPEVAPDPADEIAALLEQVLADDGDVLPPPTPRVTPEILSSVRPVSRPESLLNTAVPGTFEETATAPLVPAPLDSGPVQDASDSAATTAPDPARLPAGTRLVQLGAFDDDGQAQAHWARLISAHADLLGGKSHFVQTRVSNGKTYYRLRLAGFDTENDQTFLCEALEARSVDCLSVTVR
ncbi:MAG: SPOR domain-containing protein, partial [Pseudomonadota bacterium]